MATAQGKPRLQVRPATRADIPDIVALSERVYAAEGGYSPEMLSGQLARFPQGQFVALLEDAVVGYCATFRIDEEIAMARHRWVEISGGGYASRHDPDGDWLYGMEVCVDSRHRGLRIGRRLYEQRKRLCSALGLKGIVFGGRLAGFSRRARRYDNDVEASVEAVQAGRAHDRALSFQLRNGFELIGLLPDYLPSDRESRGYAAHLVWRNPKLEYRTAAAVRRRKSGPALPESVRVATIQYQQRRVASIEQFATQVEYFVDIASDYGANFVVFPELFTLQLLSVENEPLSPNDSLLALTGYTERFGRLLTDLAVKHNINIIGGSHPTRVVKGDEVDVRNICYVALRDGVAADTTPNVEMVAFADLRLTDLTVARNAGTVQNLKDRRHDLYQLDWKKR